jgi:hypothetical protein
LWTADTNLKDELKDFHSALGADVVKNTFQSETGIKIENARIHEAVDYAQKGSGKIKARSRKGKTFNSTSKPKTVKIPASKQQDEPLIKRAARMMGKILGRE